MKNTELLKKANGAVSAWTEAIGSKQANRMLKNVIINAIQYYDKEKDGEKVINHILGKVIEVMSR